MGLTVVTGANRGVGLALIKHYVARGDGAVATVRDPGSAGDLNALARASGKLRVLQADVTDEFETKMQAVRCYASQFDGAIQAGEVYPTGEPLYDVITHYGAYYGSLIRTRYGEPFYTTEMMRVDDIGAQEVSTF